MHIIQSKLLALKDQSYKDFHAKLIPNIDPDTIIGVRTPKLKALAKEIYKEDYIDDFLNELPHKYYEENNLHAAITILKYKDPVKLMEKVEAFLPFIDNWATCDTFSCKLFKKYPDFLYEHILNWLKSDQVYTVRYGIVTLMSFYLDDNFKPEMLDLIAEIKSDEYYVDMAIAWYFSIALVKQYDYAIKYFENPCIKKWTHNKSIQKAIESRRISAETKDYLRSLKIK